MNDRVIAALRAENEELREEVRQLKADLRGIEALRYPVVLTPQQGRVACSLQAASPKPVHFNRIIACLGRKDDLDGDAYVHAGVIIYYIRKALRPIGIVIDTEWGFGWSMPRASAKAWDAALEREAAE